MSQCSLYPKCLRVWHTVFCHVTLESHLCVPGTFGVSATVPAGAPGAPLIVAPDPSLPLSLDRPPMYWLPNFSLTGCPERIIYIYLLLRNYK